MTRKNLGIADDESFFIHPGAVKYFAEKRKAAVTDYNKWIDNFNVWSKGNPGLREEWDIFFSGETNLTHVEWPKYKKEDSVTNDRKDNRGAKDRHGIRRLFFLYC